jgi:hypothetical protein
MAAKVFIVNFQSQCDYKVYLCSFESQQKNHQIIAGGKLVKFQSQADFKIFFVALLNILWSEV